MHLLALDPRRAAAVFLLLSLLGVWLLFRFLARYASKPGVVWGVAAYLACLHLISLGGLFAGPLFGGGLPQLPLFTFPFSMSVANSMSMSGFGPLDDLAANYVHYIVIFGTLNGLLLAGFLALVIPPRRLARPQGRSRQPKEASRSPLAAPQRPLA